MFRAVSYWRIRGESESRLPAGVYLGVPSLNGKDQALCKGLGTIQVKIKTEVTVSTLSSEDEGLFLQTCKGGQDGGRSSGSVFWL